jgi:hypothetical protein
MNLALLEGWTPLQLFARDHSMFVDWAYVGNERFIDPFFEQTIARCLHDPANVLFRHQTPIEVLGELYEERRGLDPNGFIFHMSRCGSTLVAQMLAAVARNIVISEARPVDQVLRAPVSESQRIDLLRWTVNALGQRRTGEDYFFIKFDAWHVLQLPLIVRAFPRTPWVFAYREPVEVLVSQQRERGVQVVPGAFNPALFGLDPREPWITKLDEYAARVLGCFCQAAFEFRNCGRGRFVQFSELPDVVSTSLLEHFGVLYSREEIAALRRAARFDAKRPGMNFETDSAAKQRAANDEIRRLADEFIRPAWEKLERARHESQD